MNAEDKEVRFGKRCRHHDPRNGIIRGKDCKLGINIREQVVKANGGTINGIAFKMPCYPGPECKVACNRYDPFTEEEIAKQKSDMDAKLDSLVKGMKVLNELRTKMIAHKIPNIKAACVHCGGPNMVVNCAIGFNQHLAVRCTDCDFGFIE